MSTDTQIPTPRTDAAKEYLRQETAKNKGGDMYLFSGSGVQGLIAECTFLERELAQAKAEAAKRLEAENAALRKDRERMDWLEKQPDPCLHSDYETGEFGVSIMVGNRNDREAKWLAQCDHDTLRAAIDTAMEGGER